jgi:DNA-binding beta-propeller fold protein YncE
VLRALAAAGLAAGLLAQPGRGWPQEPASKPGEQGKLQAVSSSVVPPVQRIEEAGVGVEFSVSPLAPAATGGEGLVEGATVRVQFRIFDVASGTPTTGARPAAWMDLHRPGEARTPEHCKQQVQAFMSGALGARATLDLNTYHVLSLNDGPSVTVMDPRFGFGESRLLAWIQLPQPGEDWVLSRDQRALFVSLPEAGQLAIIDTAVWKIASTLDVGVRPARVALQADGRYLWVANDAPASARGRSGVTVVDTAERKVVAFIPTGSGRHEIAFSADDRYAFVTNRVAGTLSVIDIRSLRKVKDLWTGRTPVAVAYSPRARAAYVAHQSDGSIVAVDDSKLTIRARLRTSPGLRTLRFTPDARYGLVLNSRESMLYIFDTVHNRIIQSGHVGQHPEQLAFTENLAYVRSRDSEIVYMVPLETIGQQSGIAAVDFPGGQLTPGRGARPSLADAIVPAPGGPAVVVANPADRMIYYYKEGMAAPMGSFRNYGGEPRAVLIVDRTLRERPPGTYGTEVQLTSGGEYSVAFFLDSPRVIHCFDLKVQGSPKKNQLARLRIEPLIKEQRFMSRQELALRFRAIDPESGQPLSGLRDIGVLTFLSSGTWQKRQWAQHVADGVYEVPFAPPGPGIYFVFWECPSRGVRYNQIPYLTLEALDESARSNQPSP